MLPIVCSCSSNDVHNEPEPEYHLEYTFYSEKSYQLVYRTIMHNANLCSKQKPVSRMVTDGEFYNEIKAGDISFSVLSFTGKFTHLRVNIENDNNRTKITVVNDFVTWDGLAHAIKNWVVDDSKLCDKS